MDDVSKAIGALQAQAGAGQRQRTELFKQSNEIKTELGEIKTCLAKNTETLSTFDADGFTVGSGVAQAKAR